MYTLRSPLTGRFIAKRSTGEELVEKHNRTTSKRILWDLLDAIGIAVLFGTVGFMTVWTLAIVGFALGWTMEIVLGVVK